MANGFHPFGTPPIIPLEGLDQLRMMEIFGGTPPYSGAPPPTMEATEQPVVQGMMSQTPAMDFFNELLQNRPEGRPGWLELIASSLVGALDPSSGLQMAMGPTKAQRQWQQQLEPAQAAAMNERMMQLGMGRLGAEQQRIDVSRERLALDRMKAENPDLDLVKVEGGNYQTYNPRTGQLEDTGIGTGTLTPQDEAELRVQTEDQIIGKRHAARMGEIEARGEEQRRSAGARHRQATELEETRQRGRVEAITERERQRRGRTTGASQLEARRGVVNKAQELITRNPDWADYITIDGESVRVKAPGGGLLRRGPSREVYNRIVSALYPNGQSARQAEGTVTVISPNGQRGTIPAAQLEAALQQGYRRAE